MPSVCCKISVTIANPDAKNDSVTIGESAATTINVLANDIELVEALRTEMPMRARSHLPAILSVALTLCILHSSRLAAQALGDKERSEANFRSLDSYAQADRRSLKRSMGLSAEQEKLWEPVEEALTKLAEQRQTLRSAQTTQEPTDQFERLRRRAELTSQRAEALKKLADAVQPLWVSLSDEQKRDLARALPGPVQQSYRDFRSEDRREADDFRPNRRQRGDRHYDDRETSRDREYYDRSAGRRDRMMSRRGDDELADDHDDRDRFDRYSGRGTHDGYSPRSRRYDRDYDQRSDRDRCRCYRYD